ncbi:hypothetical protein [Thermocrinis minervae]|uniref:Uncharacterized protein n=1 Tax=Thermocrinis minervae TaxID=381751 RepID=A0A1M6RSH2_9AQUI|nr:hypothetical protein [Thermocrinis minervae]SHK35380.1 hypothetical protein SAMN05444391_0752 [Thermocrinis minervae]
MTKEFEIGLELLKKVRGELEALSQAQDKLSARQLVNAIINPVTASAYQVRVGDGPRKEELLKVLFEVVKNMRDLQDLQALKDSVASLLDLLDRVQQELSAEQKSSNG